MTNVDFQEVITHNFFHIHPITSQRNIYIIL